MRKWPCFPVPGSGNTYPKDMEALLPLMNMVIYSIDKAKKFRLNREVRLYFYYKLEPLFVVPLPLLRGSGEEGVIFCLLQWFYLCLLAWNCSVGVILWKNTEWDFVSAGLKWISDELFCFLGKGQTKSRQEPSSSGGELLEADTRAETGSSPVSAGGEEESREGADHEWGGSWEAAQAGGKTDFSYCWGKTFIRGCLLAPYWLLNVILCRNVHRLKA